MRTALRKMGNSTGMIVPKALLGELGVASGNSLDVVVENGALVARPVRKVREGWAEDAARIASEPLSQEDLDWLAFDDPVEGEIDW